VDIGFVLAPKIRWCGSLMNGDISEQGFENRRRAATVESCGGSGESECPTPQLPKMCGGDVVLSGCIVRLVG